jgi:hypothetical protein
VSDLLLSLADLLPTKPALLTMQQEQEQPEVLADQYSKPT